MSPPEKSQILALFVYMRLSAQTRSGPPCPQRPVEPSQCVGSATRRTKPKKRADVTGSGILASQEVHLPRGRTLGRCRPPTQLKGRSRRANRPSPTRAGRDSH